MKEKYFIHIVLLYLLLGSPTVHSKDIGSREEFISYMEEKHGFDYKQLNLLFDKKAFITLHLTPWLMVNCMYPTPL